MALAEWAPIYAAMSTLGHDQTAVDEMELWVIATILNPGDPEAEDEMAFMERSRQEAAARGRGASLGTPEA